MMILLRKTAWNTKSYELLRVRSLEYDFKAVLVNVGNLSSSLFMPIVFSPPPPVNSNFVKARLGNGRYASSTVSFLLQYQFETRAAQVRHAWRSSSLCQSPASGGLFIIIGNDLFKAYITRAHARSRIYTAGRE